MAELEPYRPMTVRRPAQPVRLDRAPAERWSLRDITDAAERLAAPTPARPAGTHPSVHPSVEPAPLVELRQVPKELEWLLGAERYATPRHRDRCDLLATIIGTAAVVTLLCLVAWVTILGLLAWSTR